MYALKIFFERMWENTISEGLGWNMYLHIIYFIRFYLNYMPSMIKDDYILEKYLWPLSFSLGFQISVVEVHSNRADGLGDSSSPECTSWR